MCRNVAPVSVEAIIAGPTVPNYLWPPVMEVHRIPYAGTGRFSAAVLDHLSSAPFIREFLPLSPDLAGIRAAAASRTFPSAHRAVLVAALERQHAGITIHSAVRSNLQRLQQEATLTVTTGHQLCLFTGPLYVPYKILNAIRLASDAEKALGRAIVPVFWMASEDHDAAEIDHAVVNGQAIQWSGNGGGPVGRMLLSGITKQVEEVVKAMGPGVDAARLTDLLRTCYTEDKTLAEATRLFIHALFGHHGLVIVDGDDPELKRLFLPVIQEELINQVAQRTVSYANDRIKERYPIQAHAREINLFHLRPGHRSRIVTDGDHYQALDGGPRWTLDELLVQTQLRPQDFSPNVLLRPIYQETILPNIAYVGGGGELAYWLQLRWLFQGLRVPMPVFFLRTSAGSISAKHLRQWNELGLNGAALFAPLDPLRTKLVKERTQHPVDLAQERSRLMDVYREIVQRASSADTTLKGATEARRAQALRGLDRLEAAMLRAAKRDQEVLVRRMDAIHGALFPNGGLQERRDNILPALASKGLLYLERLLEVLDPMEPHFTLIVED